MESKNDLNSHNNYIEVLENLKQYIFNLLKLKREKLEEEVKNGVDNVVKSDKKDEGLLDKLKSIFGGEKDLSTKIDKYESHREDSDEYIPQDSEFGESLGEQSRFAEIYPGYKGYFTSGKKSYFDKSTNLWSKKKVLTDLKLQPDLSKAKHTYAGVFVRGVISIPLPEGSLIDLTSLNYNGKLEPIFLIDQNNSLYIKSNEKQFISFDFYTRQTMSEVLPIKEDSEKIIYDKLTKNTTSFLKSLDLSDKVKSAYKIKEYILKNKKYSTKLQGTLRDKSNHNNYISNLDKSEVLECFSANSLFVALCREIAIPTKLVVGHMVQQLDKDGKSLLSSNNGHAWSEIWDEQNKKWIRIDATPTQKEDGEDSNQNMDNSDSSGGEQGESNMDDDNQESGSGDNSSGSQDNNQSGDGLDQGNDNKGNDGLDQGSSKRDSTGGNISNGEGKNSNTGNKSPEEMLDELINKAKDNNLVEQAKELDETIEKLKNANTKENIKEVLDNSGLSDFAKDIIDEIGNGEILKQETEEIKNITDENELEKALENSLLNKDFKEKLKDYADEIRKQILEEKQRIKTDMEKMGFTQEEKELYELYKELEKEVNLEVKKQIKVLEKILPPSFRTIEDQDEYYKSGNKLGNTGKLIEYELIGDEKVFRREKQEKEVNEINMFETILIDRSGSMGKFKDIGSALREAVKAAIIRAKVLEHFKVNFSIIIFDTQVEEVMGFGEKFSSKKKNNIPSKLMRAVMKNGSTDIGKPLTYTLDSMKKYSRKNGFKSFGNISFLGDGEPTDGLKDNGLKALISEIRNTGFGLTAYYINGASQKKDELISYFGLEETGGTVLVSDVTQLTEKLIGSYNQNLKKIIKKYTKN